MPQTNVLQNSTKRVRNWYFANFEITTEMCCDDPPSHTEEILSSSVLWKRDCFHHGTDVVAIAMALPIDKKADAAKLW